MEDRDHLDEEEEEGAADEGRGGGGGGGAALDLRRGDGGGPVVAPAGVRLAKDTAPGAECTVPCTGVG